MPNHIHTYERSIRNRSIYRCTDPECTLYHQAEYLIGKVALCNKCRAEFKLERAQLIGKNSVKSPVCLNCSKSKKAQEHRKVTDLLKEILEETEKIA